MNTFADPAWADSITLAQRAHEAIGRALRQYLNVDLSCLLAAGERSSWSLSNDALQFVWALVSELVPCHIVEFGSGSSTVVMALASDCQAKPCFITSVEHDPDFLEFTRREFLTRPDLLSRIELRLAPLVARDFAARVLPAYHPSQLKDLKQPFADLVVIDGPPVALGGREGTLYQALDLARPGTVVLMDDAKRLQERCALSRWRENLGYAIETMEFDDFEKGLAAIVVRVPVRAHELDQHRLQLLIDELISLVPLSERLVVADSECYRTEALSRWNTIPFLERDGEYWGSPDDDGTAIRELYRLHQSGARFFSVLWPQFWYFDCYPQLAVYLDANFKCLLRNDRIVLYDLAACPSGTGAET
jgi:predicted O-methyltransferase YrrM